jgi:hypothetical protein
MLIAHNPARIFGSLVIWIFFRSVVCRRLESCAGHFMPQLSSVALIEGPVAYDHANFRDNELPVWSSRGRGVYGSEIFIVVQTVRQALIETLVRHG